MQYTLAQDLIDAPEFEYGIQSGRAVADDRGNMIWEWQTAPGVYTREVTPQQLFKLSAIELELLDTQQSGEPVQWSRARITNQRRKSDYAKHNQGSTFDFFLRKMGLSA
jgi:hypothetical protein